MTTGGREDRPSFTSDRGGHKVPTRSSIRAGGRLRGWEEKGRRGRTRIYLRPRGSDGRCVSHELAESLTYLLPCCLFPPTVIRAAARWGKGSGLVLSQRPEDLTDGVHSSRALGGPPSPLQTSPSGRRGFVFYANDKPLSVWSGPRRARPRTAPAPPVRDRGSVLYLHVTHDPSPVVESGYLRLAARLRLLPCA